MNRKCWTTILCLVLATILMGDRLAAAEPDPMVQLKAKMTKDGWKEVAQGVFERQLGPNNVERVGFGREGLSWTLGELSRRLASLEQEQELYPSAKLAKIVDDLRLQVGKTQAALRDLDFEVEKGEKGLSNAIEEVTGGSCSSICYNATASAYPLTSSQGVAAVANASFNSACGYSGETYAYAYSRATLGTTTTTITQSDPDSGTSVTSSATATSNGGSVSGIPCYSEASSYAQSSALGISYSTSATNSSCPPVACTTATIAGTTYEYFAFPGCRNRTWTVSVNSGCTATSYQWKYNGTVVGTGSSYTRSVCPGNYSFTLEATVNGTLVDTHVVQVVYEPEPMCGGVPC
jgi:hypothetical protein